MIMPRLYQLALLVKCTSTAFSFGAAPPPLKRSFARAASRMPELVETKKTPEQVEDELARAKRFIGFLDASPEPFHVVSTVASRLKTTGFVELDERDLWGQGGLLEPGGKYFYSREGAIVAFTVGGSCVAGEHGFKVIGAHTDSPALKVKPRSKRGGSGFALLGVETYGGGLWHTWFDRDLSLAGRVVVEGPSGVFKQRLVHVKDPILRVPTLCIHLQSTKEREAFAVNKEDHLSPILCTQVKKSLEGSGGVSTSKQEKGEEAEEAWVAAQDPVLLDLLASELGVSKAQVVDFDLTLYDTQGGALGGARKEFVNGARLDNLASCFAAVEALETHASDAALLGADRDVSVVALFDHEEVGSGSESGAGSPIMRDAVERITEALAAKAGSGGDSESFRAALHRSMILSVDMAHAVHPNYASKHEKQHAPAMNSGLVIKSNANQRYATSGTTGFLVRQLGRRVGVPVQEFVVRNDCPCGSTIGPIIAANTGMRAIDLGMPQLSMHSCREMMGRADLTLAHTLFAAFFSDFRELDESLAR